MRLLLKSLTYATMHVVVAVSVAYALTQNLSAAIGIGFVEPIVQTAAYAMHERLWRSVHVPKERY